MRERISNAEYSELTDAFNGLFEGQPIDEPTQVSHGNVLTFILGKEFRSSRGKTVTWVEQNAHGSVPLEFTSYKRSEGVSEKRHKMLNFFGKVALDIHAFEIISGPAMGADYQIQSAFSRALIVDLDNMRVLQMEVGLLHEKDPVAAFCESALSHINDIRTRSK